MVMLPDVPPLQLPKLYVRVEKPVVGKYQNVAGASASILAVSF
jgi:hypothetical protein